MIGKRAALLLILLLLLLLCGCVHYLPREEGSVGGTTGTETSAQTTSSDAETTTAEPATSEADTGFPNEPESDATKRY